MTEPSPRISSLLLALSAGAVLLLISACGSSPNAMTPGGEASIPSASGSVNSQPSLALSQAPVQVESNPPGDIPDNLAYVPYRDGVSGFAFTHPEGWAQAAIPRGVTFSDKLNSVVVTSTSASTTPTVAAANQTDIPALRGTQAAFELRSVSAVTEHAGGGVLIVYRRNSALDPVTGRQYRDEVQRYELLVGSHVVVMELAGPVGADNVDPYKTMINSLGPA